ncbi:MAG TPA: adenylate/guanylate cyclase domain-containing protein [Candidatus Binataceae bacterium]|jgi:adenylate cyclase|nr:adenylate/guanylate cyclase domain-containing protein [Candidatus Binataceae bacterium]
MAETARKHFWKSPLVTVAIGLAVVVAMTYFNHRGRLESIELSASDLLIYRPGASQQPSGAMVIARIDDKSIAELGRWPWGRDVQARLVKALIDYGAAVVGFDVMMPEPDSADVQREEISEQLKLGSSGNDLVRAMLAQSNDAKLAAAIRAQGSTYLAYSFSALNETMETQDLAGFRRTFLEPRPLFYNIVTKSAGAQDGTIKADAYLPPISILNSGARGSAYVNIDLSEDGKARSYPTVVRFDQRYCVPLFLALVDAFARHPPLGLHFDADGIAGIRIGGNEIPVDEAGRMTVHFRGPSGTIPWFSIADIIDRRIPPDALKGRIVLVGLTAHALGDRFVTPVGADFPGVEIQANAADNVLVGDFLVHDGPLEKTEEWAGLLIGVAISFVAAYMTAISGATIAVILGAGYFLYAIHLLNAHGQILGFVFPLLVLVLTYIFVMSWRYFAEGAEKRHLRNVFEHYLDPDVIASVVDNPAGLKLGGERRRLSILFSDIVNFTSRAERTEPEPLVALLNTYMTVMTNLILQSGGVVDKLMGDGIMAFWGAPVAIGNPAREAVKCALRMMEELAALAKRDERFADIKIGIGICTGDAIVGNFGGEERFDYSVIGDTVNLASRLEGLTRPFKVGILANRPTLEEAGSGFITREIGLVKVKGKDVLVPVVEIVALEGDGVDPAYYQRFAGAIAMLRRGDSPESELRKLLHDRPDDQVTAMCLDRLHPTDGNPPREMVFEFDSK